MKIGDVIRLSNGAKIAQDLESYYALLIHKAPRPDELEYDWEALCDGRIVTFGRQIEKVLDVINER